ncbi:hypothetical protein ACFFQW_33995 [Umezawaea endophytica]|uniref:DUF308 domain-containing protein n=1 Tax=Umezawaea endophytica TaxID=1654476 RepID=A0A9X2VHH8_9PSEU|nr:hypothetical protein [Umezawaea endophytica]MCS7476524.1 hypothetical protein [Umezawaea endophytica]
MDSRRDSTDGPEDVDAAFAEIVASLERDGMGANWPDPPSFDEPADEPVAAGIRPEGQPRVAVPEPDDEDDDEHFVPPDPPPLPRLRVGTIAALVIIVVGVVLLVVPQLFGLSTQISVPVALVVLCGGVGWLVMRVKPGPPPDSGWDDGAVL